MAKQPVRTAKKKQSAAHKQGKVSWSFPLKRKNLMFLGISLGVILLGYGLMSTSLGAELAHENGKWNNPLAVTVAPLILAIGYCILVPVSLMKNFSSEKDENPNAEN